MAVGRFSAAGLACAFAVLAAWVAPARAADHHIDYLAVQAGAYDMGVFDGGNELSAGFGLEYRAGFSVFYVHPFLGVMGTTDSVFYGYGGILIDIPIGGGFYFTPSGALGGYNRGDGQNLGFPLEFRTGLELTYRFEHDARLGLMFHHISNASLGGSNPGSESLFVTFAYPLKGLFGN
jgi:lipid A 3-O-deacylase